MADKIIFQEDGIQWLQDSESLDGCSIITSLPDFSEFSSMSLQEWQTWFQDAATLIMQKCPPDGVSIFFQSDIKVDGIWIDKGFLCQKAAQAAGCELLFHKIICRTPPGTITFGRPSYSHLLCFSKNVRPNMSLGTADVLPDGGAKTWTRGMGVKACELACKIVLDHTTTQTIVDPFCGHGALLAVANSLGLNAIGVELSAKRAAQARQQTLEFCFKN